MNHYDHHGNHFLNTVFLSFKRVAMVMYRRMGCLYPGGCLWPAFRKVFVIPLIITVHIKVIELVIHAFQPTMYGLPYCDYAFAISENQKT